MMLPLFFYTSQNSKLFLEMEETIVQEHTFVLERAPGVGFGIAVSGGRDNPSVQTGDPSIIISDVIRSGPAFDKLKLVFGFIFKLEEMEFV